MASLSSVPGIGPRLFKLLESAGFSESEDFEGLSAEEVLSHLEAANRDSGLMKTPPSLSQVQGWMDRSAPESTPASPGGVNYEEDADVMGMLAYAAVAQPLDPRHLAESGVSPTEVTEPIYLNHVTEEVHLRVSRKPRERAGVGAVEKIEAREPVQTVAEPEPAPVDVSRVRSVEEFMPEGEDREEIERRDAEESRRRNEAARLTTTTRAETNKGRNPNSRRYIRGVLHPLPGKLRLGGLITLLVLLLVPLSLLIGFGLFLNDFLETPPFPWMSDWLLLVPAALPIVGFVWLLVAPGCRCRVCGQKLYLPKNCLKHRNAHKIPLIGYIVPTALHLLVFHWFRCIFCGTPIRLKE